MKDEFNMDKIFREKLEDYTEKPPEFLWNSIQAELIEKKNNRKSIVFQWISVAALIAVAFIGGWVVNEVKQSKKIDLLDNEKTQIFVDEGKIKYEDEEVLDDLKKNITKNNLVVNTSIGEIKYNSKSILADSLKKENIRISGFPLLKPISKVNIGNDKMQREVIKTNTIGEVAGVNVLLAWDNYIMEENRENVQDKTEDGGWKIGMNISPGYSSYFAEHGTEYAENMTYKASDGNKNLSGGVSVQYNTGKRWAIESGIYYSRNGQKTGSSPQYKAGKVYADVPYSGEKMYFNTAVMLDRNNMEINSTAGTIEFERLPSGIEIAANLENAKNFYSNSFLTKGELSQVFDFVEIPVYLRYLIVDSNIGVEILGGINTGIVVGNNAYIDNEYGLQKIGKTKDIAKVNIAGTLGVGLNYGIGKHLSLSIEPRINYYLHSINNNPEVDFRPYRIGIYSGVFYNF